MRFIISYKKNNYMNIKTKYNIGDTFWKIFKDVPTAFTIDKILITVSKNTIEINYTLLVCGGYTYTYSEESLDCNFTKTKKELLCRIFNDCIEDGKVLK